MSRAVILDRDGTIVVDRNYLSDPEQLQFEPGAVAGLRKMVAMGFQLVVITNQSGIGRGFFTLARLQEVHQRLRQMLDAVGVPLAGIYSCPHTPQDGCDCRKPGPALMRQASEELGFNPAEAIVIGDKESDVEFGRRTGALTLLIAKPEARASLTTKADHIVANLEEAAAVVSGRLRLG